MLSFWSQDKVESFESHVTFWQRSIVSCESSKDCNASLEGSDLATHLWCLMISTKGQCLKSFFFATHDPVGPAMALLFRGCGGKLTAQFQGTQQRVELGGGEDGATPMCMEDP